MTTDNPHQHGSTAWLVVEVRRLAAEVALWKDRHARSQQLEQNALAEVARLKAERDEARRAVERLKGEESERSMLAAFYRSCALSGEDPGSSEDAIASVRRVLAERRAPETVTVSEPAPIDVMRFTRAPCYLCGYNGEGYYQAETHPSSTRWREEERRQYERTLTPYWADKPPVVDVVGESVLWLVAKGHGATRIRANVVGLLRDCLSWIGTDGTVDEANRLIDRIAAAIAALEGK